MKPLPLDHYPRPSSMPSKLKSTDASPEGQAKVLAQVMYQQLLITGIKPPEDASFATDTYTSTFAMAIAEQMAGQKGDALVRDFTTLLSIQEAHHASKSTL